MNRTNRVRIKFLLAFFSLVLLPVLVHSGVPKDVSGVINQVRAKVTGVGADYVILDDVTGFAPGDTVLVIQMKGEGILTSNDGLFGRHQTHVGDAGYYEFIVIQLVEGLPDNKVTFYNNLKGTYNPESFVQVIRVESYEKLTVTGGDITCPPWDINSGTGGVIAIFASDRVELYNNINVSGKGFRGGLNAPITGSCLGVLPYIAYFDESSSRAGRKGEGFASHNGSGVLLDYSLYVKGVGAIATGGGGGDGSLSGGGGGSSYGSGGIGGEEVGCGIPNAGGAGGYKIAGFYADTTVIMGGGGGASGYTSGSAPNGGAGGGIIFLMTDSVYSYGGSFLANGQTPSAASSTAGGAGGGGGGSIVVSSNGYGSGGAGMEANGGNGSNSANLYGFGGGGSGGFIWVSPADHTGLTVNTDGGLSGNYSGPGSSDGENGFPLKTDLQMRLNGFLFNTIVTAKDGNVLDSICYGQVPKPLKVSVPVGGTLPFTIYWEKSYAQGGPWVPLSGNLSGTIFTPDQTETTTLWIRRRIVDSSSPIPIEDISKSVKVIVHPLIYDFAIDNAVGDTICYNQVPLQVDPVVATPGGGNGIYFYDWQQSANGTIYDPAILGTSPSYSPPALTDNTWYRRKVSSGACVDSSSAVKFTVLPVIENNAVGPDQTICEGDIFDPLVTSGSPVAGGDGTFRYKWEASIDNIDFNHTIEGTTNQVNYDPDETSTDFPSLAPKYYRRTIYSGEADCCVDVSPSVSLILQPAISNNGLSILAQNICEDVPGVSDVTGTTPLGGTGDYTYMWEERLLPSGPWVFNDSTRKDLVLSSRIFTNSTSFRRVVISGECMDISTDEFVVTVEPKITGNTVSTLSGTIDTVICSGQDPRYITGPEPSGGLGSGTYTYLWEDSTASHNWQPAPLSNTSGNYDPGTLTETTWFRRRAFSGQCESASNSVKITVLPVITGNTVGSDQFVCYGTEADPLSGTAAVGGGDAVYTYLWESDTDPAFLSPQAESSEADLEPGILTTPLYYRRTVYSGLSDCCQDISNVVSLGINSLPIGSITPLQDESVCEGEDISLSLSVSLGAAPYSVIINDGTSDLPINAATEGTIIHPLTPSYTTDKTLDYVLYSIVDANGCFATSLSGNKHVDFYEMPVSYAGPDDQECGYNYTLGAIASVGTGTWSWDGPSIIFDDLNNPNSGVTIPGIVGGDEEFIFWWKEVNGLARCVDSASAAVHFWMEPTISDAGNDSTLLPFQRDVLLYANQPTFGTGMWSVLQGGGRMRTGDEDKPNGLLEGMSDGINIVEWVISNGVCEESFDQVGLYVPAVRLISGFSPNNDGINDFFEIEGLVEWDGDVVDNELIVTDMTGVVLYREENYANDWDGRDLRGKPLPSGTYYYFINVYYSKTEQLKGFVVIKRD